MASSTVAPVSFRRVVLTALVLVFASLCCQSRAFTSQQVLTQREPTEADVSFAQPSASQRLNGKGLRMAGFFDDVGKFFEDAMGAGKNDPNGNDADQIHEDDDDEYAGATRLLTIPAKSIKPGGLRLLLMFYLMGMQNTPERHAWKADQPTRDEYVVDMYYHDRTAVLTVKLTEDEITIDRIGTAPSMSYLTQESVIVDGILDELQICVSQEDIKDDDRLLLLPEPQDAIEKARESLAFS